METKSVGNLRIIRPVCIYSRQFRVSKQSPLSPIPHLRNAVSAHHTALRTVPLPLDGRVVLKLDPFRLPRARKMTFTGGFTAPIPISEVSSLPLTLPIIQGAQQQQQCLRNSSNNCTTSCPSESDIAQ